MLLQQTEITVVRQLFYDKVTEDLDLELLSITFVFLTNRLLTANNLIGVGLNPINR